MYTKLFSTDFLYTSFYGPDLSKDVIDDLVILCKLVVGLAGNRWWLIIGGLLYESIDTKLQSLAHPALWRLTRLPPRLYALILHRHIDR